MASLALPRSSGMISATRGGRATPGQRASIARSVPDALLNPEISELTAEPLLCYLVVLSGFHERAGAGENRNLIYRALYESVVERRHAGGAKLAAAKAITDTVLDRLMEAIAVAAWWHTEGRIASVEQIRAACGDDQELHEALETRFRKPVTGLRACSPLSTFVPQKDARHGGNAFEFTHKSFSEYLTARRLVREITEIHDDLTHSRKIFSRERARGSRRASPPPRR